MTRAFEDPSGIIIVAFLLCVLLISLVQTGLYDINGVLRSTLKLAVLDFRGDEESHARTYSVLS